MPRRKRKPAVAVASVAPGRMSALMEEYLEWMGAQNFSPDTLKTFRACIGYFLEWCGVRSLEDVVEITRPVLERYQRSLYHYRKKDGSPLTFRTQNGRLRALKGWFRWLARQGYLLHNPASELILPRLENRLPKHVLSVEDMEAILRQPDVSTMEGLRDRAILETFYATGMRRMEVANLKLYDLDRERGSVMVRMGKGKKDRHIPISERALRWIAKYTVEARPSLVMAGDDGTVFLEDGEAFERIRLTTLVRGYIRKSEIGKTGGCHLFRHTVATLMLENGADIRVIQEMLGHAKLTTTEMYTRVSINLLQQVYLGTHPSAATGAGKRVAEARAADVSELMATELMATLDDEEAEEDL